MIRVRDLIGEENVDYYIQKRKDAPLSPKVSVLMPTYCRGDNGLLKRAIESVLNQTFRDFELIVIDDGSTDMTRQLIGHLMKKEPRLIYIRNHHNSGLPSVKVMQGFQIASAEYIAYQFDDDQWYPDALETMYEAIQSEPVNTFAYAACDYIKVMEDKKLVLGDKKVGRNEIFRVNSIPNNTVIHHRELFDRYGAYDPHLFLRRLTDWDLWKRWMDSGAKVKKIDRVLSIVEEQRSGSLYATFDSDIALTRIIGALPVHERNPMLTPQNYLNYEIDDLSLIQEESLRNELYCRKIKPYYEIHAPLVRRLRLRKLIEGEGKPTLMIIKKNHRIEKDRMTEKLLRESNPYFHTFYMQAEHLLLDSFAIECADACVIVGESSDLSHEALKYISQKPYIQIQEESKLTEEIYQQILRQIRSVAGEWREREASRSVADEKTIDQIRTELKSPKQRKAFTEEEIDHLAQKNRIIEEQDAKIQRLNHQLSSLMGYAHQGDDIVSSGAVDVSELCDEYDRLRFDKKTKFIRHITKADYEGNRLYREIIREFGQEKMVKSGYYAGFSSYLSEQGEELSYPLYIEGDFPECFHIYATNYNTAAKVIVATLQLISKENEIIAELPLRGIDIRHKEPTTLRLPKIRVGAGRYRLRLKPESHSHSCGISLLEWKIRAFTGKIKDKRLCSDIETNSTKKCSK